MSVVIFQSLRATATRPLSGNRSISHRVMGQRKHTRSSAVAVSQRDRAMLASCHWIFR